MSSNQHKQLYIDVGTQIKTFLRGLTLTMSLSYALVAYYNGFQHNTHFRAVYSTCLFVAVLQTILILFGILRKYLETNLFFMFELFLDFFSFAISALIGSIATARCEFDSPVKPCYHSIMRAPIIGCTIVGTLSLVLFTLTMFKK
jgi:hypothetical protein